MLKPLIAAAVAAGFALTATAADDKASGAGATKSDGGAEAMFKALDKDGDGKLSREEHAAAPEHQKAAAGGSSTPEKKPETSSKPKY